MATQICGSDARSFATDGTSLLCKQENMCDIYEQRASKIWVSKKEYGNATHYVVFSVRGRKILSNPNIKSGLANRRWKVRVQPLLSYP